MSSWDTNPWSNFCDLHWKLICCHKWHLGTWEKSASPEVAVGTHFHEQHGSKTIPVFLHADGEASWLLLPISVSLLSGATVQPENTYSCILKLTGHFWILFTSLTSLQWPYFPASDWCHIKSDQYFHFVVWCSSIGTKGKDLIRAAKRSLATRFYLSIFQIELILTVKLFFLLVNVLFIHNIFLAYSIKFLFKESSLPLLLFIFGLF